MQQVVKAVDEQGQQGPKKSTYTDPKYDRYFVGITGYNALG